MSDHSEVLRRVLVWDWPHDAEVRKTTEALTLVADVLDAIPDKDDPLRWVQSIEKNLNDRFDLMLARKQDRNEQLQAELDALLDAIPGDDKLATVQWAVKIAAEECDRWRRAGDPSYPDPDSLDLTDAIMSCPPSVRAALRQRGELT